jgi:hypothetical protein
MKKYQYLIVNTSDKEYETLFDVETKLDQLGRNGWLLVSINGFFMYFVMEL